MTGRNAFHAGDGLTGRQRDMKFVVCMLVGVVLVVVSVWGFVWFVAEAVGGVVSFLHLLAMVCSYPTGCLFVRIAVHAFD